MIQAFPKIFHVGESLIGHLFVGQVEITEKIDGSQWCFGKTADGELEMRSKGQNLTNMPIPKMFQVAADRVMERLDKIPNNCYFYTEYLETPHHNTLKYARTPLNNLYLFGVLQLGEWINDSAMLVEWARVLDIEPPVVLYSGEVKTADELKRFMDTPSILGGEKIEGVVIKNYAHGVLITPNVIMPITAGKFVQEGFKERNGAEFRGKTDRGQHDILVESYRTEARWVKAIQHLRENGQLTNSPKDIGALIKEINRDIDEECAADIKERLYKLYIGQIHRKATAGFPEWYKEQLLKNAFNPERTLVEIKEPTPLADAETRRYEEREQKGKGRV